MYVVRLFVLNAKMHGKPRLSYCLKKPNIRIFLAMKKKREIAIIHSIDHMLDYSVRTTLISFHSRTEHLTQILTDGVTKIGCRISQ